MPQQLVHSERLQFGLLEKAHFDTLLLQSETASKKLSYEPFRFPQTEPQALTLIELEKVRQYIKERQPRWWRAFYLKEWCGVDAKEIAAELDVDPSRVYQLVDAVRKLAQRYREENK